LRPSGVIYRLAKKPDPWLPPDWASAGSDGTFGNRFDDPDATYRVLYASSQRLGCFLETLARFRVDPTLLAELAEIEGEDDYTPLREVPLEWLDLRTMGTATSDGEFADICSSEWVSKLRRLLAAQLEKLGVEDLDASVLQQTAPRILTQFVSRLVFYEDFAGIYYRSKYGHDIENWALFEPFQIANLGAESILATDPDLQRALQLHGLRSAGLRMLLPPSGQFNGPM
jgi:RES domain